MLKSLTWCLNEIANYKYLEDWAPRSRNLVIIREQRSASDGFFFKTKLEKLDQHSLLSEY